MARERRTGRPCSARVLRGARPLGGKRSSPESRRPASSALADCGRVVDAVDRVEPQHRKSDRGDPAFHEEREVVGIQSLEESADFLSFIRRLKRDRRPVCAAQGDVGQDARKGPENTGPGRVWRSEERPRLGAGVCLELRGDRGDVERAERLGVSQPDQVPQQRLVLNLLHRLVIPPVGFAQCGRAQDAPREPAEGTTAALQSIAATGSMKSYDRP